MTKPAPLLEAVFELRWGEVSPGQFYFNPEESSLLLPKFSAEAASKGFQHIEVITSQIQNMPLLLTHRFRRSSNVWPCYQIGLGIMTVNQAANDYSSKEFKEAISVGLEILKTASPTALTKNRNPTALLRYQDAFYPSPNISTQEYIDRIFNIKTEIPKAFLENQQINEGSKSVQLTFEFNTSDPNGVITLAIANAVINNTPGILMETIVHSVLFKNLDNLDDSTQFKSWLDKAHLLQRFAYEKLINQTEYNAL